MGANKEIIMEQSHFYGVGSLPGSSRFLMVEGGTGMNIRLSLRLKLILGFGMITVPLILFLLYSNLYARNVVRKQVAESNLNLLSLYGDQIDRTLGDANNYLFHLATLDTDIRSLSYAANDQGEFAYFKIKLFNKFSNDYLYYPSIHTIFVYTPSIQDVYTSHSRNESFYDNVATDEYLKAMSPKLNDQNPEAQRWTDHKIGGSHYLLRVVATDTGSYVGALIKLDELTIPLKLIHTAQLNDQLFMSDQGEVLTATQIDPALFRQLKDVSAHKKDGYRSLKGNSSYLAVYHPLDNADLNLVVFLPEKNLLELLPFLREIIIMLPFLALLLLVLFLTLLQKVILTPVLQLLIGMRRIKHGDWDTRLPATRSKEFMVINESFNEMISQIQELKIHLYEEEIRSHKAEIKQLHLQINPHFLFNSINIIYNLAEVKNFELIQRMARHMVSYFRFVSRSSDSLVTLKEELEHVDHYMQIQRLRFPRHLEFHRNLPERLGPTLIPPLLIQPFLENAVKHGLVIENDRMFEVTVEVRDIPDDPEAYEVVIQDNGPGFPAYWLDVGYSRHSSEAPLDSDVHLGIWNVWHRLRLYSGNKASLTLENAASGGAKVRLKLPIQWEQGG